MAVARAQSGHKTPSRVVATRAAYRLSSFAQHPDEHRPKRPILLCSRSRAGEGAALWLAPEHSDPVGSLEVGEHQDVEQLGAGSGTERVQTGLESPFDFIWTHGLGPRQRLDIRAYAVYTTSNVSTEIGFGILTWLGARPTCPTARSLTLKASSVRDTTPRVRGEAGEHA
jgi:hypothetical protein